MPYAIAIIGRPNVGKSTLFNRLTRKRDALVAREAGLTRDVREARFSLEGREILLMDTAGLEEAPPDALAARMTDKTRDTLTRADLCLFLIDARAGLTGADLHWASFLRRLNKPIILVANKCEGRKGEAGWLEAHQMGFEDPLALSAEHAEGVENLWERLRESLPPLKPSDAETSETDRAQDSLRLAVVGRPNTGKSTLVNRLLGAERMLTGPEQGLTRDSIETLMTHKGVSFFLVDTAGLRKKARMRGASERLSVKATLHTVRRADIVFLLMDANTPFEKQDLHIAQMIESAGKMPMILLNKIDEAPRLSARAMSEKADHLLPQLRGVHVCLCSAKTGKGLRKLPEAALRAKRIWETQIPTSRLNRWLEEAGQSTPPPSVRGRAVRLKYITQTGKRPPSFTIFATRTRHIPQSYMRYLANDLRKTFDVQGTPLRLHLTSAPNPYLDKNS